MPNMLVTKKEHKQDVMEYLQLSYDSDDAKIESWKP